VRSILPTDFVDTIDVHCASRDLETFRGRRKNQKESGAVSCLKSLVYYAKIALPNRICSIDESKKESCSSNIRRR
jgi:hypothetical protein